MAKLFAFLMVSLDGYFEGPNHNLDWHTVDGQFNDFAIEQTSQVGTLVFGRKTYQLMASYWPSEQGMQDDPQIAELMNDLPKVIFSRTMQSTDWQNAKLATGNLHSEIQQLKQQPKDVGVFGSSNLCVSLIKEGLIDEFRIMVSPVILGAGTPLFQGINRSLNLDLATTRKFDNGNILLTYTPKEVAHA